jgi:glucoamylase
MSTTAAFVRAQAATVPMGHGTTAAQQSDLQTVAQHMYSLMLRNICSDGLIVADPYNSGQFSAPGCVLAAPSYPGDLSTITQDYVFNWVRDAALTAIELVAAEIPAVRQGAGVGSLKDYVNFAKTCQDNATPTLSHACFTIEGQSRPWSEQSDGPALQTVAMLLAMDQGQLDAATQATAVAVITKNVDYLLTVYQEPTYNLWEEHQGLSFFTRSVQLRCFEAIASNPHGIPAPAGTADAIASLRSALEVHWNGSYYVTMLAPPAPGQAGNSAAPPGYDPNIDIVQACVYGAVPCTDTRLLATAALLRHQWADSGSPTQYAINAADAAQGMGPLLGRYPGDTYDGDFSNSTGGHPWALCTGNFAELYYRVANEISAGGAVPLDNLSTPFFAQVGVTSATSPADAVTALTGAGDAMLRAIIYHSDNLELSEQFDGSSGFEKSVRDLTWSYGAFLSAVRARNGKGVQG